MLEMLLNFADITRNNLMLWMMFSIGMPIELGRGLNLA